MIEKDQTFHASKLHQCNQILSTINTKENIEKAAEICQAKISQLNFDNINALVLESLINSILSKVLIVFRADPLTPKTLELIEFIREKKLISPLFESLLVTRQAEAEIVKQDEAEQEAEEKVSDEAEDPSSHEKDNSSSFQFLKDSFNSNLDILLSLDTKADKYVRKSFGYSFLNLNGDFIWCDAISEQFFEMKSKEIYNNNFFDLMIPLSSNLLHAKFGAELFKAAPHVGSSLAFSYVIYSKKSTNKFLKQLKKKGITNMDDLFADTVKNTERTIYYRYLKALSSRVTLVVLKFTTAEFRDIVNNKKYDVNISESINQLLDNMGETFNSQFNDTNITPLAPIPEAKEEEFGKCIVPKVIRPHANAESKDLYKLAIMVETRISKNIPDFNYGVMTKDEKIKEFEDYIRSKLDS